MAKRLERLESVVLDSDGSKQWGVYHVTRFPMTGTTRRRLLFRDPHFRMMESYARGYAEEAGLSYRGID